MKKTGKGTNLPILQHTRSLLLYFSDVEVLTNLPHVLSATDALLAWAKQKTNDYPGVEVANFSGRYVAPYAL